MNRKPFVLCAAVLALLAGCAAPSTPASMTRPTPTPTPTPAPISIAADLVLVNGLLIDGTGAGPVRDAALLVRGDRIVAAGLRDRYTWPANARVIDVGGAAILPGFINAHVHSAYDLQLLEAWVMGGVTTVRDEGIISSTPLTDLLALRDEARRNPVYARLVSAGYMLTAPGGYGQLHVTSAEDARRQVIQELDAGVDLVKVSLEDGYAGRSGLPKLTDAELRAIVAAAHERGALVSGHITQARYIQPLLEAGVDDIAHTAYDRIPDVVLQRMADDDVYLTPTFTVFRNYGAPMSACVDNVRRFAAAGGKVALGNDYGGGPGEFEKGIPMYEIDKLSEAGLTPMQIIVASTRHAAHAAGLEDELGTLQPGKLADVLVVDGDPLSNLEALKNVRLVIHSGVVVKSGH